MARTAKKAAHNTAAKKTKTKTNRGGVKGRSWTWGHVNIFITDTKKWSKDARLRLPGSKMTVRGIVFRAMQQLKKGSDETVIATAVKMGLKNVTKQNVRKQVQMKLRKLRRWGVITRAKHTKKARRSSTKARSTKPVSQPVKVAAPSNRATAPARKPKPAIGQPKPPAASKKRPVPKPKPAPAKRTPKPAPSPVPAEAPSPAAPAPAPTAAEPEILEQSSE